MADLSRISSSGMAAQQRQIDTVANNIANADTTGYKQCRLRFQDQAYRPLREVLPDASRPGVPAEWRVGEGVAANAVQRLFWQGELVESGNPLDIAIAGPGFIQVALDDGSAAFTRDGALTVNGNRQIVTADGYAVVPGATLPQDATSILVSPSGAVWATSGEDWRQIGSIDLVTFQQPAGLLAVGRNLFQATAASGEPQAAIDGAGGMLQSGMLEGSNVDLAEEMTRLMQSQRAYEANLKAFQTWDELLSQANDLQRG